MDMSARVVEFATFGDERAIPDSNMDAVMCRIIRRIYSPGDRSPAGVRQTSSIQLFQRRRWIHPDHLDEGIAAFVGQLAWIDAHTGLSMAGWRAGGPYDGPTSGEGAILATTTYEDHAWFLYEVAELQALTDYRSINDGTAALTVGSDAFERWDAPVGTPRDWTLDGSTFRQDTGIVAASPAFPVWTNAEGAEGLVAWFPGGGDESSGIGDDTRSEVWRRIH